MSWKNRANKRGLRALLRSFRFACAGLWVCVRVEQNFRLHLVIAAYVLFFARFYELTGGAWATLLISIGFVLTAEAFNTALERAVDFASEDAHPLARAAKDAAAAAVLLSALTAVAVGVCLFGDWETIVRIAEWLAASAVRLVLLALSLVLGGLFVFAWPARSAPPESMRKM